MSLQPKMSALRSIQRMHQVSVGLLAAAVLLSVTILPVSPDTDARYGDIITYVSAYANAHNLRYTGTDVKAFQSVYLQNYSDHEDVSYSWRFRIQITEVEVDEDGEVEFGDLIREEVDDDVGSVQDGDGMDDYRYMSVSAHGLMAGAEYGMKAYTRLTVTGRVDIGGGRHRNKTEEWFVEPKGTFMAR